MQYSRNLGEEIGIELYKVDLSPATSVDENNIITKTVSTSYKLNVEVPAFRLNGHVVWGATAMMLSEIKDLLKLAL